MAIGLSCPSLSAPSLAIRAMMERSPCGHLSDFSTSLRMSVRPLVCVRESAQLCRAPSIYSCGFTVCQIVDDVSDFILCNQRHVLFAERWK
eukprot:3506799-Heterocapsa_arctica.AAC.1